MSLLFLLLGCNGGTAWETTVPAIIGIANLDDDNQDGRTDWDGDISDDENDLTVFEIPSDMLDALGKKDSLRIRQNNNGFRVYVNGTLKSNSEDDVFDIDDPEADIEVEFQSLNTTGSITVVWLNKNGDIKAEQEVDVISAPMLLNHHLQAMEQVYAMEGNGFVNNQEFIQGFETALGEDFTAFDVRTYEWDVWLQDEIEFANLASNGTRLDIVINSIRDRGLDKLPENELSGADTWINTWGSGMATSQDSFGNLEVAPPVEGYPYGRIYYGDWYYGNSIETITEDLTDEFTKQELQLPFKLDVTFLCVGHVDEYMTFVPDASSPKGFKFMLADVNAGYDFLDTLDASMSLPKYASDHGFATVGSIVNDGALRRLNEDIQLDYLDPTWEAMQAELGLTEEDLIRVPMLFEEAVGCQGYTATLMPSTLNMVVATNADGTGADLIMPDPYFRSTVGDQSQDPFIEHVNGLLPEGNTPHWIDDWADYHMMLGEVHCGSNTLRTPMNIEATPNTEESP